MGRYAVSYRNKDIPGIPNPGGFQNGIGYGAPPGSRLPAANMNRPRIPYGRIVRRSVLRGGALLGPAIVIGSELYRYFGNQYQYPMSGWTQNLQCLSSPINRWLGGTSLTPVCVAGQGASGKPLSQPVPAGQRYLYLLHRYPNASTGVLQTRTVQHWVRAAGQPRVRLGGVAAVMPHPYGPGVITRPVGVPMIAPQRVPQSPTNYVGPTREASSGAQPGQRVTPRQRTQYNPRPPGPGVKERKGKVKKAMAILIHAAFEVTEFVDIVDAFHDALPKELQTKSGKPQDRLKQVYRHASRLDLERALFNLLMNQLSDFYVGGMMGRVQKQLEQMGISHQQIELRIREYF